MIESNNPSAGVFRSLVARLHPGSTIRFLADNADGSVSEMEMRATMFDQLHKTSAGGNEVPDGPPKLTVWLRETKRHPATAPLAVIGPSAEAEITSLPGGKTLSLREKAVPNSVEPV